MNNVDNWIEWALKHKETSSIVIGFLSWRPEQFEKVDPHNWVLLATVYKDGMSFEEVKVLIENGGTASEFISYAILVKELPSFDSIISDPENVKLPKELRPCDLYQIMRAFGSRVTHDNFDALVTFILRLNKQHSLTSEWVMLFLTTVWTVNNEFCDHPAYIKMCCKFQHLAI